MKKYLSHFYSILFIIAVFFNMSGAAISAESAAAQKTVIDYYLQLPDRYFQCETENMLKQKDKLSLIKNKNLKKGYIQASTLDGGIPIEIFLFTDDYMGIKVLAVNLRCGSGCMCRKLDFFFISEGKLMKNEGGFLFPKIEDIEKAAGVSDGYEFILPDDGSGIKVSDEQSGKILLNIEWSGGTFNLK